MDNLDNTESKKKMQFLLQCHYPILSLIAVLDSSLIMEARGLFPPVPYLAFLLYLNSISGNVLFGSVLMYFNTYNDSDVPANN